MNINFYKGIKYVFIAAVIVAFFYIISVKHYPWYYLVGTYAVIFIVFLIVYYTTILGFVGNIYFSTGKTAKAEAMFQRAIKGNPKNATIYLNYAILLVRNGDATPALEYLKKAQSLKPQVLTDKNIMLTMGSCYWVMGEIDKAVEVLESLRNKYDYVNCSVLITLGYMYLIKGDYEKAWELSNKAILDTPESGSAWDNLGQISFRQGDLSQAKESFLKAVQYKENLVDSYYYLGVIAEEEKLEDDAKKYFQKAHSCTITSLNTITKEQVDEKYIQYFGA